jgi:DNA-binding transcriptional LysR family regulator
MLLDAAVAGIGIVRTSLMKAARHIDRGQLVDVMPTWTVAGDSAIWAVFPSTRHMPHKLRVFLDFFATYFRELDEERRQPADKPENYQMGEKSYVA